MLHDQLFNPEVTPGCAEGVITEARAHFGNLNTNISIDRFNAAGFTFGDMVHVIITHDDKVHFEADVLYQKSFGFVAKSEPIVFNGSMLYVGIALNQDNFVKKYDIGEGESWKVRITKV